MPLLVFLTPGSTGEVRRGDMVFHIAHSVGDKWKAKRFAHTGIAEERAENYQLHQPATVIHMGFLITKEVWTGSDVKGESRIDVCGTRTDLDDLIRDDVIDKARVYYEIDPSIFEGQNIENCYWMGDPLPNSHPLYPFSRTVYGFSCSSFAHYCYAKAGITILDLAAMPVITDAERLDIEGVLGQELVQSTPFSRLYPSYLMNAFQANTYPFSPGDWEVCKQHAPFIPADVAA